MIHYHALTLTTLRFPFCPPLAADPAPPGTAPALSCALIPAFTVSISTPVATAGEYADTRVVSGGCGSGGTARRRPLRLFAVTGDLLAFGAGCLPFPAGNLVDDPTVVGLGDANVYGSLGTISGLSSWIWDDIFSNSCFSAHP